MLLRTVVAAAVLLRGAGACTATLSIDIDGVSVKLAFDNTSSVFGTALRHVAELGDAHGGLMGGSCETGDAFCAAGELADGAHALLAERCGDGGGGDARPAPLDVLQVGAHEGDSPGDPLYAWLRHRAAPWVRAVLVEPMRASFEALVRNYAGAVASISYVHAAVAGRERRPLVFYEPRRCDAPYPDASHDARCVHGFETSTLIASTNWTFVYHGARWIVDPTGSTTAVPPIARREVAGLDWRSILEAHGASAVGVLVVDAEAMDCDLVASFPFDVAVPDVIVFEQGHCAQAQPKDRAALDEYLTDVLGYARAPGFVGHVEHDACYVLRSTPSSLPDSVTLDPVYGIPQPFAFDAARGPDPRRALAAYCREHGVGAFDCATAHRLVQELVAERRAQRSGGDPRGGRACDAYSRAERRAAFLAQFPEEALAEVGSVPGRKTVRPAFYDEAAFAWPYSGGREEESVGRLLDDVVAAKRSGGLFVDIGANRGDFAAALLKRATARWRGLLYEPDPAEVERLEARFAGDDDIVVRAVAAGAAAGVAPMVFPDRSRNQPHPHASFAAGLFRWKHGEATFSRNVSVVRVEDDLRSRGVGIVDVLKVDAEGADRDVLDGAESLLAANRIRLVLFEYGHGWLAGQSDTSAANLETTVKWLDGLGYDVYLVGDVLLPLHGDCWFADLETWAWSNVVAVSRSAAPALAETLAERAAREVASVGGTECSLALSLNGAAVELRAPRAGGERAWRAAVASVAAAHDLRTGGDCHDTDCVADSLLDALLATCGAQGGIITPPNQQRGTFGFEFSTTDLVDGVQRTPSRCGETIRYFRCPVGEPLCDVLAGASAFCDACGVGDAERSACVTNVWRDYAEQEFLAALNYGAARRAACDGSAVAGGAYPCALDRTNQWFEMVAERLPMLLQKHDARFPFLDRPIRVLEVGAYEGGSTTFFQRYLLAHERSSLLAVDTWRDTSDPEAYAADGSAAAAPGAATLDRFRRNVAAAANARKVTALRGDSATVLARLVDQRRKFDFVYVDGSHRASEVLVDVALAWRLLRSDGGGVMLLDDYGFKALPGAPRLDPADAATGEMACAARVREVRELTTGEAIEAILASVPGGAHTASAAQPHTASLSNALRSGSTRH